MVASKGECRVKLVSMESIFLVERLIRPADIEPPDGISKSLGCTIPNRSGPTSTEAELSTVSAIVLNAIQQPE